MQPNQDESRSSKWRHRLFVVIFLYKVVGLSNRNVRWLQVFKSFRIYFSAHVLGDVACFSCENFIILPAAVCDPVHEKLLLLSFLLPFRNPPFPCFHRSVTSSNLHAQLRAISTEEAITSYIHFPMRIALYYFEGYP